MPRPRAIETVGRTVGRRLRPRVDKAFIEIDRAWHMVNGYGQVCGRLASKIVPLLCGKHKPTYQPQRDMGDYVVVLNVAKTVRCA
jgi:ribosomal protein L13